MHGRSRLLITGASGFIGRHLVPALVGRGHHVVAAVRRPLTLGPSVDLVLIKDLADGVDWVPLLQGIDVVIHLAALAHQDSDVSEKIYDKINRQPTATLARATAKAGVKLIFLSSIAAQSPSSSDLVLTEYDPCLPTTSLWPIEAQRRNRGRRCRRTIRYSSAKPRLRGSGEGQHEEAHSPCKTVTTASFWRLD